MNFKTLLVSFFSLILTNCATIFSGTQDSVHIKSNPEGASVYVNGLRMGESGPIYLKRGFDTQTITLKKDGYQDLNFMPQKSFNSVSILNIFFPLGFVIDAATGAMMKQEQTLYVLEMEKKK